MKYLSRYPWFYGLIFLLLIFILFYFRYHIIYPGVSKVKIVSPGGGVSKLTIPNEMMSEYTRPTYGELGSVYMRLDKLALKWGKSKYYLTLNSNGNNNSILRISLPNQIAGMKEVESRFRGYKMYVQKGPEDIVTFFLTKKLQSNKLVYIKCSQDYAEKLKNCSYYGIYDKKLRYKFMFPGKELDELEKLIIYAETTITNLLDKE